MLKTWILLFKFSDIYFFWRFFVLFYKLQSVSLNMYAALRWGTMVWCEVCLYARAGQTPSFLNIWIKCSKKQDLCNFCFHIRSLIFRQKIFRKIICQPVNSLFLYFQEKNLLCSLIARKGLLKRISLLFPLPPSLKKKEMIHIQPIGCPKTPKNVRISNLWWSLTFLFKFLVSWIFQESWIFWDIRQ